jgi:hypothetical protein
VVGGHCQHQRRQAANVFSVDFGAGLHQHFDHLVVGLGSRQQQGRHPADADLAVLDNLDGVAAGDVHFGPMVQKKLDQFGAAVAGGDSVAQRGITVLIGGVDVDAFGDEEARHFQVVDRGGDFEDARAGFVHGLDVRAFLDQQAGDFH